MIDFVVVEGHNAKIGRNHYIDHMAPVWHSIPETSRGQFHAIEANAEYLHHHGIEATLHKTSSHMLNALKTAKHLTVVAGHRDPAWLDRTGRPNAILMHGVGFVFDAKHSYEGYPGTNRNRQNTKLILSSNETIAALERVGNPSIHVEVIGCPKLDKWQTAKHRPIPKRPTIALAWHWRCFVSPNTFTAFDEYREAVRELSQHYTLLGHGHPSIIRELAPIYEAMGIETVYSLAEVFERADMMVADATSAIFEFASLDRPVVPVMSKSYKPSEYGGMYNERLNLGAVCHTPAELLATVQTAIKDDAKYREARRTAIGRCYTYTDGGCAARAAAALMRCDEQLPEGVEIAEEVQQTRARHARTRVIGGVVRHKHTRESRLAAIAEIARVRAEKRPPRREAVVKLNDNRDAFLARMGWRIPKAELNLPDPSVWPAVGIIIPVFNAPILLERCLRKLRETDYAGTIHIQIVDNASTDAQTLKMLRDETAVIRFDSPVGFSEAVNRGMEKLTDCDYHILYNQDVAAHDPQWLNHLMRWMEARPECGLCGPKLLYDNGDIETCGFDMQPNGVDQCSLGRNCTTNDPQFNDYRKVHTVCGAVYCLRVSVEAEMGLFDERYLFGCEDLEYGMRLSAKTGSEVWYVPDAVLTHSSHAVVKANKGDRLRVLAMRKASCEIFEREWNTYRNHLSRTRIAFILPDFQSAGGGNRVVAALARQLSICGVHAEVFVRKMDTDPDKDFPQFPIRPIHELHEAEIVVATRCDTLKEAKAINAAKRYYFVQQIEDCMAASCGLTARKALDSYQDKDFEIITIGQHLHDRLAAMGRESHIVDVGLYREMYPYMPRKMGKLPRVLMYGADGHKGPDNPAIAAAIRKLIPGAVVNCFHRYARECQWADTHYRPQTTAEVAAVYADHDIYVYASDSDGFAMTPIEAMACGTLVVLSDFPGKEQYAKYDVNCLIAPFRDVEAIAEHVQWLTKNKQQHKRLIAAGLATADRYDWNKLGAQYAKLMLGGVAI